jgi:acyl-CoA dehydrogenase
MTEPGAGSDLKGIRTRAARDGESYLLNGSKTFITNGGQADLVIVAARTDTEAAARGISLFLVDTTLSGFSRGVPLEKLGQHGQDTCELFFDHVRLDLSSLLGQVEGQGFVQLMEQLPQERLIVAIQAVVPAETALTQTLDYTKQRRAFGERVFDFQNTQFTLAEAATHTRVMRTFLDDCILRHLSGELDVATAAMAKWWCTDRSMAVLDDCLQLHGGYGYMKEYPIARMWVDQRVQRIYAGTNEIMKRIIARSL